MIEHTRYLDKSWKEYEFFKEGLNLAVEKGILKQEHVSKTNDFYDGNGFTLRVIENSDFTEIGLVGRNIKKGKDLLSKLYKNKLNGS